MRRTVLTKPLAAVALAAAALVAPPAAASEPLDVVGDTVDEISCNYGDSGDSLWIHYRNPDALTPQDTVFYGADTTYGKLAIAVQPAIVPVDQPGSSFREAELTGLAPGQLVHYRIGAAGLDHTCGTPPTGNFRWDDIGDTGTTLCTPWVATTHSQVAADNPDFVTHGGDVSYANYCGEAAVHQYYIDQQAWSTAAAFQPVWGNHEYGAPTVDAPPGTPRDRLANYKGRSTITHAQTVPNDTLTRTSQPGCPALPGTTTNSCMGEDWGWFKSSGVLFISYPEPYYDALADWQKKADVLMANAQADPSIKFVVTYGHRAAYTNQLNEVNAELRAAVDTLGDRYGAGSAPGGKYVLNVAHHVHGEEAFTPMHGVVHLTNGGGGEGSSSLSDSAPGSLFKTRHPGYLTADYDAAAGTLAVRLRCGPEYAPNPNEPCTLGSTLYSVTFTAGQQPPPGPQPPVEYFTNQSVETSGKGFLGVYSANDDVTWSAEAGFDGTHSIRIRNTAAATQPAGLANKPVVVTSTTAGVTYTGSVWVRTTQANQPATIRLWECDSAGTCSFGSAKTTSTLVDTGWRQLKVAFKATRTGDQLKYAVVADPLPPGVSLYADMFSLTKPAA